MLLTICDPGGQWPSQSSCPADLQQEGAVHGMIYAEGRVDRSVTVAATAGGPFT